MYPLPRYTVTVHTSPKWRKWGATARVWAGAAHRGTPSGGCRPVWLSGWRSLAAVRRGPRDVEATAAAPGWRKGHRRTGWPRLHAGTSCQRRKTDLDKSLILFIRQPVSVSCIVASVFLDCRFLLSDLISWALVKNWFPEFLLLASLLSSSLVHYMGLLPFIYPSCPAPSLPPCYLHPMSSLLFVSMFQWGQECPATHQKAKDSSWSYPVCVCVHVAVFTLPYKIWLYIYDANTDF